MPPRFRAMLTVIATWMAATWLCGVLLLLDDGSRPAIGSMGDPRLWGGTLLGGAISAAFSPLSWAKWNRSYFGAAMGLPIGICILFAFFFVFPHSWQATRFEAWKSTVALLSVYAMTLVPICSVAGWLSTWLVRRKLSDFLAAG